MRHRKKIVKLGRMSSHRNAMLSNMAGSIINYKKIHTTLPKANAVAPLVEKLITLSKQDSLHARRLAFRVLKDKDLIKKLFGEIAPSLTAHKGGYTRIIRTGVRTGDGAPMAIIELVVQENKEEKQEKEKKGKEKGQKPSKEKTKVKEK